MDQSNLQKIQLTDKSFISLLTYNTTELLKKYITEITNNPPIIVYGKTVFQHRSIGFFSNDAPGYRYAGQITDSQILTPTLQELLNLVNTLYNSKFNGILVNRYDTGSDFIGPHSDDESVLDDIGAVCISYGVVRTFRIRNKITKEIIKDIPMSANTYLHMGGDFQNQFTYEIPIEKKVKGVCYTFTFRKHLDYFC